MENVVFAVCKNIEKEALAVLQETGLSDIVSLISFSTDSCNGKSGKNTFSDWLNETDLSENTIFICSSTCGVIKAIEKSEKNFQYFTVPGCLNFLISPSEVKRYAKEGGYIFTGSWFDSYEERISEMGFHGDEARMFFNEFSRKLVYLKTRENQKDGPRLNKLSVSLDLPVEIAETDTLYLSSLLKSIYYQIAAEKAEKAARELESSRNSQIAEYELLFSMIKTIANLTDESLVIEQIKSTCSLLYAPESVTVYLVSNIMPENFMSFIKNSDVYEKIPGRKGFLIKITHRNSLIAIIEILGIKNYKYIDKYINIALGIADVFAMAISNARVYGQILDAKRDFDLLIENAEAIGNIGVFQFDWENNKEFISAGLRSLLGFDKTEPITYKDILKKLHQDDRRILIGGATGKNSFSARREFELKPISIDGKYKILSCMMNVKYNRKGSLSTTIGICRDITEFKALQSQLRIKSHMDSIGTLASGYAHEINNPLTGIVSYAQLIIDENTGHDDIETYAMEIINEGARISKITGSLLMQPNKMSESIQNCRINDILTLALESVNPQIEKNSIIININDKTNKLITKSFCSGLKNVFIEILKNSIRSLEEKFSSPGEKGVITITLEVEPVDKDEKIRISILDNGTGIKEENVEKVFDPFFSTYPKNVSMGMGLTSVYNSIKRINGAVWINSKYGEYTEIIIELPNKLTEQ